MRREKTAWLVSVILVAILAFQIPGTLAHRDDDYAFIRTLLDIHRQVTTNYVDAVDDPKLQQAAIDGMLGQLDPYTIYIPAAKQEQFENMLEGNFKGVGIQLDQNAKGEVEVITPIEDSPAFKAGVQAGDIIVKVNGEDINKVPLDQVMIKIKGPINSSVKLTVRHPDGQTVELTMTRQEIVMPSVKGYHRGTDNAWNYWVSEDPKIAYVRIIQFTNDTFDKLKGITETLLKQNLAGLVLDLRFDPGGRLDQAEQVVNLFVKQGVIVKVKGRNRPESVTNAKAEGALPADFPLVVLVNEHSASASEIVAGSLKDNHRAIVVGTRTFGKGSVQEVVPLGENEGELKITVAYYYLPSGRLVHRKKDSKDWGVDPQIEVAMDSAAQERLVKTEMDQDVLHGPVASVATKPTTHPAEPQTQPADPQLDAAVNAVKEMIRNGGKITLPATTHPATQASE